MKTILILLSFIQLASAQTKPYGEVFVDDYGAIGNNTVGALGFPAEDSCNAFKAALAAIPAGGTLRFGKCKYTSSCSLVVDKEITIAGNGGSLRAFCGINFKPNVPGIIMNETTTLKDIALISTSYPIKDPNSHGIIMKRASRIEHVTVRKFSGDCIHIDSAGVNNNLWEVIGGSYSTCLGHGIYTRGADSNAGLALHTSTTDNGHGANGGFGIYEDSFLGNAYVASHTDANVSGAVNIAPVSGNNNKSMFLHMYTEDNTLITGTGRSIVLGGIGSPKRVGPIATLTDGGGGFSAHHFTAVSNGNGGSLVPMTSRLGGASEGTALQMYANGDATPYSMTFSSDPSLPGWYNWKWSSAGTPALSLSNSVNPMGANQVQLHNGMLIGPGVQGCKWTSGSAPLPTCRRACDRVFNSVVSPGAVSSWVCTQAGTPGVWKEEARIAQ